MNKMGKIDNKIEESIQPRNVQFSLKGKEPFPNNINRYEFIHSSLHNSSFPS